MDKYDNESPTAKFSREQTHLRYARPSVDVVNRALAAKAGDELLNRTPQQKDGNR